MTSWAHGDRTSGGILAADTLASACCGFCLYVWMFSHVGLRRWEAGLKPWALCGSGVTAAVNEHHYHEDSA